MYDETIGTDEFELIIELIIAVFFMLIGAFGISTMVRQLSVQTEVTSRVDKVNVSSIREEEVYPFYFTGYQAYMFAWMMDGHDDTAILWSNCDAEGNLPDLSEGDSKNENYILLDPAKEADGFIVKRNRAIVGADEYAVGSVKQTLANSVSNPNHLWLVYSGRDIPGHGKPAYWYLDYTDAHTYNPVKDEDGNVERIDYLWTIHLRLNTECSP